MAQKIRTELIGSKFSINYNGVKFSGTVSDTPENIEFYSKIGLDIFEFVPSNKAVEVVKTKDAKNTKKRD